jgi:hypothetical protein
MKERDNYETIRKVVHLYTKKIHNCLDLLTLSIHKHVVLNVLISWASWALCLAGSRPKVLPAAWRQMMTVTKRPTINAITLSFSH